MTKPWFKGNTIAGYTAICAQGEEEPLAWVDFKNESDFNLALSAQDLLAALQALLIVTQPFLDKAPVESALENVGKQARSVVDNVQNNMVSAAIDVSTPEQNASSGMELTQRQGRLPDTALSKSTPNTEEAKGER